jgi:tetratricopeptide (TPR) repeat protein
LDQAIADYDAALKLNPRLAPALYGRGVAEIKRGNPAGTADIAAAKAIQPNIAAAMAALGVS